MSLLGLISGQEKDLLRKDWIELSFQGLGGVPAPGPVGHTTDGNHWCCPPQGVLKINTDTSLHSQSGEAGKGVVVIDSLGLVKHAWAVRKFPVSNISVPEAEEIQCALLQVQRNFYAAVEVQSDSSTVIALLIKGCCEDRDLGVILTDTLICLSVLFK
ncbi:hypothetical protein ACH5RR_036390 [Cinchona calisaya]|uniref:RNase H type-1 domain-containing protein n=1 Tax=Cinchona calisaya TaxID=153742 RepID=A0ABD2Y5F4_9GENT